ncbi:hypothetical protein YC2023_066332 [Brassica napus]
MSASTHRTSVAVRVCPSVSVSTHRTSVAVCVCPSVSVSTHRTSVAVPQYTYQHVGRPWLFVAVRQHTHDVRGCPSAHTGRLWVFVSTHRTSVAVRVCPTLISTLVLGLRTLTLLVDCSGDFGPRRLSVQYTQDVRGCPPAHTGRSWLSVCVRLCPSAHTGRPWLSLSTHISTLALPVDCLGDFVPSGMSVQYTQDVHGGPPAHTGRLGLFVSVRQHTQDVLGCLWLSVSTHRTFVGVAHTGRLWLSISTHISTLVLGLCMLALPVDCLGDFGPRGLSVQYTHDVRGCPPEHTGCPWRTHRTSMGVRQHTQNVRGCLWLSVSTHRTSVCVRVCPSAHTGRSWVSLSTHMTFVCVRKHTEDVCGCTCVSVSTDRTSVAVHQYTYQHVGPWTLHAGPSRGLFGLIWPTWAICSVHTGRPWVFASTHRTSVAVRVCPSAHTGRPWLSISIHISMLVLGLSTLALPVDCLGDFGPRGLSVQYTQNVCGCPSAHTGRPCVSISTHRRFVAVRVCPCVSVSTHMKSVAVHQTSVGFRQHTQDVVAVRVCASVSVRTHMTSLAVPQYTYQHVVHTGSPWVSASTHRTSVAVCGCPSAHTGRPCVSVSVCQHTQDVLGCPSAHTKRLCVSVSIHKTSVAVRVCPSALTGRSWLSISTHISTLVLGLCTLALPVDCLGDFGPRGLSVQYTQDVRGCPPAHTGRPWLSLCVCVCPSAHTGRPRLSISTHISTLVLGLSTLTLPVDCSGDLGPRGLSVQYTHDVRGCPSAHTGRLCVSVSTHRTFVAVRVCSCVSVSTHMTSVAVHKYTYQHVGPLTPHADPSCGLFG